MIADAFAPHMADVALKLWGEPNKRLSTASELRFGAHGSRSVDLEKAAWFDHEAGEGGGVLALVKRETRLNTGAALDWLRSEIGIELEDRRMPRGDGPARRIVATYDYVTPDGEVSFQVVRFDPKDFRQRRPDPSAKDGWSWSIKGATLIPYRLPDVLHAMERGERIRIVEGEKDADRLWDLGFPATCNPGGAGKWSDSMSIWLTGANVLILPDNDEAGRKHRDAVAVSLSRTADTIEVLELPGLPPKGDVSWWLENGGSADELATLERTSKPWREPQPEPPISAFGAVMWRDIAGIKPRKDWTVRGLVFPRDLGLIYGESRAGKSFIATDMGVSIARGVPFFDMPVKQGPVLYQAGEGQDGLVSRLHAHGLHHNTRDEDLPFVLLKSRVNLYSGEDPAAFIDECRAWQRWFGRLSAIFIDTFSAATAGANENASEDVSRVLGNGKEIKDATGAAIIFVHHKNAGGQKARGHTSLFADADFALDVERGKDDAGEETNDRWFTIRKVKDGEDGKKFGFRLQPVEIGSDDDGKSITSCVIDPAQDGSPWTSKQPDRKPLAQGQSNFLFALDAAISGPMGGLLPPNIKAGPGTMGVEWPFFVDTYRRLFSATMDDGAIRTAVSRDGQSLITSRLIDREDRWVWITEQGRLLRK